MSDIFLPEGITLDISAALGTAKSITATSNANPGVASSDAHGFTDGDILLLSHNWSRLDETAVRVDGSVADAFNLEGFNTTATRTYPAGQGTGSAQEVTSWTRIEKIFADSLKGAGGDPKTTTDAFLDDGDDIETPTGGHTARKLEFQITDDATRAGYIALKDAAEAGSVFVFRLNLPEGGINLYAGRVGFNESPSLDGGKSRRVSATIYVRRLVRYAA